MLSPTVKIGTILTPGSLGMRYASVVVLGPMGVAAAALRGSSKVGPPSSKGAEASAPFKNVRRSSVFASAPRSGLVSSLSFGELGLVFLIGILLKILLKRN